MPDDVVVHQERSMRARIAAHTMHSKVEDPSAHTAPAREAFKEKFLREADGDPVRAEHLRKAYFTRLALKSAQARRRSKALATQADLAEAELSELAGGAA